MIKNFFFNLNVCFDDQSLNNNKITITINIIYHELFIQMHRG